MTTPLLRVEGLACDVTVAELARRGVGRRGPVRRRVLDGIDLTVDDAEAVGIVGASGSGKTSLLRTLAGVLPASAGTMRLRTTPAGVDGDAAHWVDLAALRPNQWRPHRRTIQLVSQDPYAGLSPRRSVGWSVAEPLRALGVPGPRRGDYAPDVEAALEQVGLVPATMFVGRKPHELSGGQRQRVTLARCLVLGPRVLLADEPTSMIDSVERSDIVALLQRIRRSGVAMVIATHDLATAARLCQRLVVIDEGRVVEAATPAALIGAPRHPATRALVAAARRLHAGRFRPADVDGAVKDSDRERPRDRDVEDAGP